MGVLEGGQDGGLGNFVEDDAFDGFFVEIQRKGQMPGNGLAFAVQVGCQIDFGGILGDGPKFADEFFAGVDDFVGGLEIVFNIDV